eukprot:scaffold28967_cov66-Phaeocystis_antarctica.AAC.6
MLATMNEGLFEPVRGGGDKSVPMQAAVNHGGFWGPFLRCTYPYSFSPWLFNPSLPQTSRGLRAARAT